MLNWGNSENQRDIGDLSTKELNSLFSPSSGTLVQSAACVESQQSDLESEGVNTYRRPPTPALKPSLQIVFFEPISS